MVSPNGSAPTLDTRLDALRTRYSRPEANLPTLDEIKELIQAAVEFDRLEWAALRGEIKRLAGGTVTIADLNAHYKEAKKAQKKHNRQVRMRQTVNHTSR